MGIKGLWEALAPAVEGRSFTELAVSGQGYWARSAGSRPHFYRIGVDASIWLKQCAIPFRHAHHQAGENPELRTLFYRLARLYRLPVSVVVVFDGDLGPPVKRGVQVLRRRHWLEAPFQQIAKAFKFTCHTAPGEAEAELARMNRSCLINAVLSDDVDALAFGALQVIRNPNTKTDGDNIKLYNSGSIECKLNLDRGAIVLIALLSGGDYSNGLRGCGMKIAYGLAQYGLGDQLIRAGRDLQNAELVDFLAEWRQELCRLLREDPDGHIGQRCTALADTVPNTFPQRRILRYYTDPVTSWSQNGRGVARIPHVSLRLADLGEIASFCSHRFGWGPSTVQDKMSSLIWEGHIVRSLCIMPKPTDYASSILKVINRKVLTVSGFSLKLYHVRMQGDHLLALAEHGIAGARDFQPRTLSKQSNIWIPLPIVQAALPQLLKVGDECEVPLVAAQPSAAATLSDDIIDLTDDGADVAILDLGNGVIDLTDEDDEL